jgi:hypothetical protein
VVREGEPQLQHFLFTLHKSQRLTLAMPEVLVSPLKDGQLILNSVFINQET